MHVLFKTFCCRYVQIDFILLWDLLDIGFFYAVWVSNPVSNQPACRASICHRGNHSEEWVFKIWGCTWRLYVKLIWFIFLCGHLSFCLTLLYSGIAFSPNHHWSGIRPLKGIWICNLYIQRRSLSCNYCLGWQGMPSAHRVYCFIVYPLNCFYLQWWSQTSLYVPPQVVKCQVYIFYQVR